MAAILVVAACVGLVSEADAGARSGLDGYSEVAVRPSATDAGIVAWDTPSRVFFDPASADSKVLLWLAGTGGTPEHVPNGLFVTALEQGYRVIALSYISEPAVAQVCRGELLQSEPQCAAKFRQKRIYGDGDFAHLPDTPKGAIAYRLTKLLAYLNESNPAGGWGQYLHDGKIQWDKIAVAGQSQGGGMAEYIGQQERVDRVLSFSGGWDFSASGDVAEWYSRESRTPPGHWYGTYHAMENFAGPLAASYRALGIPAGHVFALNRPLPRKASPDSTNPYHGQGAFNPVYQPIWSKMLGNGHAE